MRLSACHWVRSRLPLLSGGELRGPERRWTERHLVGCPSCQARLASLHASLASLHAAGESAPGTAEPPSLWPDLARQIRESRRPTSSWRSWERVEPRVLAWTGAGLAACLLLAVTIGLMMSPAAERLPIPKVTVTVKVDPPSTTSKKAESSTPSQRSSQATFRTTSHRRRSTPRNDSTTVEEAPDDPPAEDLARGSSTLYEPRSNVNNGLTH